MDRRWLLGGLLVAGGVGLLTVATRRPKIGEGSRVLLFGDSLAVGLNQHMPELANEAGVAYLGHGIVGSTMTHWAHDSWLDETLVSFQPTLTLVSLGTNDEKTFSGAAARERPAMEEILEKLAEAGTEVVWIGPPALPFPRQGVSDMIREAAPFYFRSEELSIPRGPDGLHPTASGYAGWAGAIWRWLS